MVTILPTMGKGGKSKGGYENIDVRGKGGGKASGMVPVKGGQLQGLPDWTCKTCGTERNWGTRIQCRVCRAIAPKKVQERFSTFNSAMHSAVKGAETTLAGGQAPGGKGSEGQKGKGPRPPVSAWAHGPPSWARPVGPGAPPPTAGPTASQQDSVRKTLAEELAELKRDLGEQATVQELEKRLQKKADSDATLAGGGNASAADVPLTETAKSEKATGERLRLSFVLRNGTTQEKRWANKVDNTRRVLADKKRAIAELQAEVFDLEQRLERQQQKLQALRESNEAKQAEAAPRRAEMEALVEARAHDYL